MSVPTNSALFNGIGVDLGHSYHVLVNTVRMWCSIGCFRCSHGIRRAGSLTICCISLAQTLLTGFFSDIGFVWINVVVVFSQKAKLWLDCYN